jgi:putative copper export protein
MRTWMLVVVGVVLALGAWNWRRQKPRMGSPEGAVRLRRSATTELMTAGVVLAITAILVSLPSPKRPGAAGPGAGARIEGAPTGVSGQH